MASAYGPHIQVTAAVIIHDGRVLLARRGPGGRHAGRWEFPGGKQEPGETLEECVVREIEEELGFRVYPQNVLIAVDHDYGDFSLTLTAFVCHLGPGERQTPPHTVWVEPGDIESYDLLPPDRRIAAEFKARKPRPGGERTT